MQNTKSRNISLLQLVIEMDQLVAARFLNPVRDHVIDVLLEKLSEFKHG
jgi:hypothetical protein